MKTIEHYKKIIEEAEAGIAACKKEEADKVWPKHGEAMYYIAADGYVSMLSYHDGYLFWLSQGSLFRTKEEAIKERECRAVVQELKMCEGVKRFVFNAANYAFTFGYDALEPRTSELVSCGWEDIYFTTPEQRDSAIKKVGADRIIAAMKWSAEGK